MRSENLSRLAGTLAGVLSIVGCAALDGTGERPDEVPDAGVSLGTEAWKPPSPFIAGTALIPLQQPLRCHRFPLDETRVAFTWTPSGQRRVYAAIYDQEPMREETVVLTRPIWTWMTGGSRSDVGRLHWLDGVAPGERDLPDWTTEAPALVAGRYWFVLWAWDESRNVVASSEARTFFVHDLGPATSELTFCCDRVTDFLIPIDCAPEEPPEVIDCPGADAGETVDWPCFCDHLAAGASC